MTLGEFLKNTFGIDTNSTIESPPNPDKADPKPDTTPPDDNSIIESKPDNKENPLAAENARLLAEVASLKQANAQLAAGRSIDSPVRNNLEEMIYSLYGGRTNGKQNDADLGGDARS